MPASSFDTKCCSCFKTLQDPYILPCNHHVCHECLLNLVKLQGALDVVRGKNPVPQPETKDSSAADASTSTDGGASSEAPAAEEDTRVFYCPLCNKKAVVKDCAADDNLRRIIAVEADLAEKRAACEKESKGSGASSNACGFCGQPAEVYCCFCGPLCLQHHEFLHVQGPLKMHEVSAKPVTVLETLEFSKANLPLRVEEKDNVFDVPACHEHFLPLDYYCTSCETLVCSSCASVGNHKGHQMEDVFSALLKRSKKIPELVKKIEENRKVCDDVIESYQRRTSNQDSEKESVISSVKEGFDKLRKIIDEQEQDAFKAIDSVYESLNVVIGDRLDAARTFQKESELLLEAVATKKKRDEEEAKVKKEGGDSFMLCERSRRALDLRVFKLYKDLEAVATALSNLDSITLSEEGQTCKVLFRKNVSKQIASFCSISSSFLGVGGVIVPINFSKIGSVSNISVFPTGRREVHDGGAAFDPVRRILVSYCGSYHDGRTLFITRLPEVGYEGAQSETLERVVPFGVHGQYPVYDGKQYVYFFQSEDGSNDRVARLDLQDMTFREFSRHPDRFLEYCSGCVAGNRVFILDSDRRLTYLVPDADSWTRTDLTIEGRSRLLANPLDETKIYEVNTHDAIYCIDVNSLTRTKICDIPGSYSLDANNEALFVCTGPESYAIFVYYHDHLNVYDSETSSWTELSGCNYRRGGGGHLVCDSKSGYLYYHSERSSNWDALPLL